MMNQLVSHKLAPGVRLSIKNQAYEIAFADATNVRYASCHGGKPFLMPTTTFWELADQGVIGFLDKADNVPSNINEYGISRLSDSERDAMLSRYRFVQEALRSDRKTRGRKNLERTIQHVCEKYEGTARPSPSTLARWIKLFISSGGEVTALVPRHSRKGARLKKFSHDVEHIISIAIRDDYLTPARPTVQQIHANVIGRALEYDINAVNLTLPSARTIYRRIKELDPYIHTLKRHGKRYADLRFRAAGTSIESSRLMEMVMMDGHKIDLIVVDEEGEVIGRPNLICLFDVCTRAIVGWHISLMPFCATTALAAIKDMCSRDPTQGPGGIAESIIPDNGPDLASHALRNLCSKIGMHIQPAKSYCPDDKAFLERFFRTLNMQLIHMLPGSTFSSPTQRGDYDSSANASITLDKLQSLFKQWIEENYHKAIHSVTKRAPLLAWREMQAQMPILFFPKEDIDVIARVCHVRKISNGRVTVETLSYKSDALATLEMRHQRDVNVMVDEMNMEFVYVSPVADPKIIVRADCVKREYSQGLTKYEHDKVCASLAAMEQKDLDELGDYAYEIARWRLWNEIHKLPNNKANRRLKTLYQKIKSVAIGSSRNNGPTQSDSAVEPEVAPKEPDANALTKYSNVVRQHPDDDAFETIEI